MLKNQPNQSISAQLTNIADGQIFTGTASVFVTGDGGTQTAGAGTIQSEGNGLFTYFPTQAETNYDHIAFTFTGVGAITATIQLYTDLNYISAEDIPSGDTDYDISLTDYFEITDNTNQDAYIYGSVDDANIYFANRLRSDTWEETSDKDKLIALVEATRTIEQLNLIGLKSDPTQFLHFPINGDTIIPRAIINGCYEIAISLLQNDPEAIFNSQNLKRAKYGPVESEFFEQSLRYNVISGIITMKAWRYLLPYLIDGQEINLVRVS